MANWNDYLNPFDRSDEYRSNDRRDRDYDSYRYRPTDSGRISYASRNNENESRRLSDRESDREFDRGFGREFGRDQDRDREQGYGRDFGRTYLRDENRDYGREDRRTNQNRFGEFSQSMRDDRNQARDWAMRSSAEYGGYGRGTDFGSFGRGDDLTYGSSFGRSSGLGQEERHSSITDYGIGTGLHSGKGPKGWRRSDERIREEVSETLERHPEIDASEIEVEVKEGIVLLKGSVENRRQKRMAEDSVERLSGVKDVRNELSVNQSLFERAKEALTGESTRTSTDSRSKSSVNTTSARH